MLRRALLPTAAAALAVLASAPLVTHLADARPVAPGHTPLDRLHAENRQLRQELALALEQRQEIAQGLDRIERLNARSRDRATSRKIASLIHELEERTDLDQPWQYGPDDPVSPPYDPRPSPPPYLPGHPSTPPPSIPPRLPPRPGYVTIQPVAMAAADFSALYASVRDAGFSDQQVAMVKATAERNYFSVDQVVQLIGLASFEEARIEMAVATGARVVDFERWFLVDRAFSFSGSAATVRQRLGR